MLELNEAVELALSHSVGSSPSSASCDSRQPTSARRLSSPFPTRSIQLPTGASVQWLPGKRPSVVGDWAWAGGEEGADVLALGGDAAADSFGVSLLAMMVCAGR